MQIIRFNSMQPNTPVATTNHTWFHQVTGHPGSKRLYMQINNRYYHRDLRSLIDKFHCEHCQRNKLSGKGYGLLPEREIRMPTVGRMLSQSSR